MVLGDDDSKTAAEILDSDEISAMIDHQWNSSVKHKSGNTSDYTRLFERISETIHPEKGEKSTNSIFLVKEIEKLRILNTAIQNRYRIALGIAAGLLVIIMMSFVIFISTNRIFEKTITESIAPLGQKSQLVLADGTKVYLNSGTCIRYDNHFGKRNRKIGLVGEAYFEVSKNKKTPFIISTSDVEIKVLGTKFNVAAYPDEPVIETYVTEGSVNVKDINSEKSLILVANQKASFLKDKKQLTLSNVNANNLLAGRKTFCILIMKTSKILLKSSNAGIMSPSGLKAKIRLTTDLHLLLRMKVLEKYLI